MPRRRDGLVAAGALLVVLAVLAIGFQRLGSRGRQRALNADARRVEDLQSLAHCIRARSQTKLPATLAELPSTPAVSLKDPVTQAPYEYRPQSGTSYLLCATFATASASDDGGVRPGYSFWSHPQGRHCYQLDAGQPGPY